MKLLREVKAIVLHCSATPEGRAVTTEMIKADHVCANKWEDIGYHYVIENDGIVHSGRSVKYQGAHCVDNGMNACSLGVCYVGGMTKDMKSAKDTRTETQKYAMYGIVLALCIKHNLRMRHVHGHNEYAKKACPSFKIEAFREEMDKVCMALYGMAADDYITTQTMR